jgi:CubicO group peptidase (beta-lactamase class C family)
VRKRGDATTVTDDDAFHIGSNTKAMTALLAGTVVDAGLLAWTSTVKEVLTGTVPVGSYGDVTLAQLLSHSSGMPACDPALIPTNADLTAVARMTLASRPIAAPGKAFQYCDCDVDVAALMLQIKTGQSWEALLTDRLFTPLAMTTAGVGLPATPGQVDAPWGHNRHDTTPPNLAPGLAPAGNVHASVGDLIRYAHLYMDAGAGPQGQIVSAAALAEIEAARLSDYALGWYSGTTDGEAVLTHEGAIGTFYSNVTIYPKRRAAVITLTNAGDLDAIRTAYALHAYLKHHFALPLAPLGANF